MQLIKELRKRERSRVRIFRVPVCGLVVSQRIEVWEGCRLVGLYLKSNGGQVTKISD